MIIPEQTFLQAIAETNGAAEDNHFLVNEGINDSECEDSEQPSSDSEDEEECTYDKIEC